MLPVCLNTSLKSLRKLDIQCNLKNMKGYHLTFFTSDILKLNDTPIYVLMHFSNWLFPQNK